MFWNIVPRSPPKGDRSLEEHVALNMEGNASEMMVDFRPTTLLHNHRLEDLNSTLAVIGATWLCYIVN